MYALYTELYNIVQYDSTAICKHLHLSDFFHKVGRRGDFGVILFMILVKSHSTRPTFVVKSAQYEECEGGGGFQGYWYPFQEILVLIKSNYFCMFVLQAIKMQ